MAAQPQPVQTPEPRFSKPHPPKGKAKLRAIEAGDLVSNRPLRARCEWLMEHDPGFSLVTVCSRLADHGYPKFVMIKRNRVSGDTSHLLRILGMADQASSFKRGRRYQPPRRTEFIHYDMAVALARALDMDPHEANV